MTAPLRTYLLDEVPLRNAMRGIFNRDYGDIENFEDLYTEYIDRSGMGKDGQLGIRVNIHNLECRGRFMTGWLQIQMDVLTYNVNRNDPEPHITSMNDANMYGHFPKWEGGGLLIELRELNQLIKERPENEDIKGTVSIKLGELQTHAAAYRKQLLRIEAGERSYQSQLNMARKELKQMEGAETPQTVDARNSFLTLIAIIGKNQQHAIDKDQTSWHEFAVMVKIYNDERRELEKQNNKTK